MAARAPDLAVLPEQRRVRGPAGLTITIEAVYSPAVESLRRNGAQGSEAAHARAGVTAVDLHAEILKNLPEDFRRRMRNWARWFDGSSVTTSSQLIEDDVHVGDRGGATFESYIPVLMGEAKDTDKLVRRLPQREQECIAIFWNYEQRDLWWMCQATPRARLWALNPERFAEHCEHAHSRLIAAAQA